MRLIVFLLLSAGLVHAAIVDRVAIAIGYQAITASQIDEELRVTALLNHLPVAENANARRDAADRLIQQFLITRETEVSHFPAPERADVDTYYQQIEQDFGGTPRLRQELQKYKLDESVFRDHLSLQLTTLRFVEFRFRPEFAVSDSEVEQRTDQALNIWLGQARRRFNILYLDKSLR